MFDTKLGHNLNINLKRRHKKEWIVVRVQMDRYFTDYNQPIGKESNTSNVQCQLNLISLIFHLCLFPSWVHGQVWRTFCFILGVGCDCFGFVNSHSFSSFKLANCSIWRAGWPPWDDKIYKYIQRNWTYYQWNVSYATVIFHSTWLTGKKYHKIGIVKHSNINIFPSM